MIYSIRTLIAFVGAWVVAASVLFGARAQEEWTLDASALFEARYVDQILHDDAVTSAAREHTHLTRGSGVVTVAGGFQGLEFDAQLRDYIDNRDEVGSSDDSRTSNHFSLDSLFVTGDLGSRVSLFGGRRLMPFGESLELRAADLLRRPHEEDPSLPHARRRQETRGDDMVGVDLFLSPVVSLRLVALGARRGATESELARSGIAYPKSVGEKPGVLVALSTASPSNLFSFDLVALNRDRGALAGSLVKGVGDHFKAYVDGALYDARDRPNYRGQQERRRFVATTIGGQFEREQGFRFTLEYNINDQGYSRLEWLAIESDILARRRELGDPGKREAAQAALAELGLLLDRPSQRQRYSFLRIGHGGLLGLDVEASVLHNHDDNSLRLRSHLFKTILDTMAIGLRAEETRGTELSEFGRRRNQYVMLFFTANFLPHAN